MIRFLKHFLFILLTTIALLYVFDFTYTQIYLRSNPRNKLQYILNTKNESYDVVFIGSSRVANHIDTKLFDSLSSKKTINLGAEGAGLKDNLLQIKLLLENNKTSNIYLQLDDNFESEKPTSISISEAMPFLKNRIISDHLKNNFSNYNQLVYVPFYRYAINDPKIGFRELLMSIINKKPRINPAIGFTPKSGNKLPFKEYRLPMNISNQNVVLNEIKDICKKNKINLVLFISPFCKSTKNIDYVLKLKNKFSDLIDMSIGYENEYFYNANHLNKRGARLFTKDLYQRSKLLIKEGL